jgi:hypothetical protein
MPVPLAFAEISETVESLFNLLPIAPASTNVADAPSRQPNNASHHPTPGHSTFPNSFSPPLKRFPIKRM